MYDPTYQYRVTRVPLTPYRLALFGNSGQDWQHNYIRKHGSPDVYRTNDNVFFLLNTNSTYWGKKPPEPKPTLNPDSTVNIDSQK